MNELAILFKVKFNQTTNLPELEFTYNTDDTSVVVELLKRFAELKAPSGEPPVIPPTTFTSVVDNVKGVTKLTLS